MTADDPRQLLCLVPNASYGKRMLVETLLDAEGIPFMTHCTSYSKSVEELGSGVLTTLASIYVPRAAFEQALELLRDAWGPEVAPG